MSKEKEFTVTVQPVLKTRTYVGGGDCYPARALGNLLARRVGVNSERRVINCKDKETLAYFRGLADAGMMHAHEIYSLMERADELIVTWAVEEEKPGLGMR